MKYFLINLKGKVVETTAGTQVLPFIDKDDSFALDRFFILKEKLKKRKATSRILFLLDPGFQAMPGHLEELFAFFMDLRSAGKELYFYAKSYGLKELYLASACQHRLLPPEGTIMHWGLLQERSYLKNLLDKLEIKAEVFRRGKYKGAADIFRIDEMDEAQREAYSLLMQRTAQIMEETICRQLGVAADFSDKLKAGTFLDAGQALKQGFVTRIDYWYNLVADWKEEKLKKDKIPVKKLICGKGEKIAVLSFEGGIVDGDNSSSPMMGKSCGDNYYVSQIARIAAKKKYKAMIFKVNSGGGSASASAEIANALTRLGRKIPVIVVQGGVAGSGGYYISFPGERIFTHCSTITGSIGVIYLLLYAGRFFEKHGITHSVLKDGDQADLMSAWRVRTGEDREKIMAIVDHIYDAFTQSVAGARKMLLEDVDKIARGRIWSGSDAVEIGICDQVGGLEDAMAYLRQKLELSGARYDFWPKQKKNILQSLLNPGGSSVGSLLDPATGAKALCNRPLLLLPELFTHDFRL